MTASRAYAQAAEPGNFFVAGKNKIINGDFAINQRAFTSTTTSGTYGFDRWAIHCVGGTVTYSAQTFTAGTAPVAGYEGINYARIVTSGQSAADNFVFLAQPIEDTRTLANQTVTVSFWAKADSATLKTAVELVQNFGSGGSSAVTVYVGQVTLSTSWARYSVSASVPSISGKTIGTANSLIARLFVSAGTNFNSRTGSLGTQAGTFEFWGVQVEAGSVATPFTTATGTLAGELGLCQRYYQLLAEGTTKLVATASLYSATDMRWVHIFPVTMRGTPTLSAASGGSYYAFDRNGGRDYFDSLTMANASNQTCMLYNNSEISGTAGQSGVVLTDNASARIAFSAEL